MAGNSTVTVTISGTEYTLRDEGNPEYVRKLAAYVDRKVSEVESQVRDLPSNRIAILAALNIADELGRSRGISGSDIRKMQERIQDLITSLPEPRS